MFSDCKNIDNSILSSNITSLTNLRKLILHNMDLDSLPASILGLNLEFNLVNKGYGICLQNTNVKDMDISILEQPRTIVESWFINKENAQETVRNPNPLNEAKVVFLGDGGAGKSLSIQRLLNEGELPQDFDGNATPGISILSRTYAIRDKSILVHFWDFGGQEIMHSGIVNIFAV